MMYIEDFFIDFGHCECHSSQCLKKHFDFYDFIDGKNKVIRVCNSFLSLKLEEKKYSYNGFAYNMFREKSNFIQDVLFDFFIEYYKLNAQHVYKYPHVYNIEKKNISNLRIKIPILDKPYLTYFIDVEYCIEFIGNNYGWYLNRYFIESVEQWFYNHGQTKIAKTRYKYLISILNKCKYVTQDEFIENFTTLIVELFLYCSKSHINQKRQMKRKIIQ